MLTIHKQLNSYTYDINIKYFDVNCINSSLKMRSISVNKVTQLLIIAYAMLIQSGCTGVAVKNDQVSNADGIKISENNKWQEIELEKSTSVIISDSKQKYEFEDGVKNYKLIVLPARISPAFLVFKSYATGALIDTYRTIGVFIPKFTFIDKSGDVILTKSARDLLRNEEYFRGTSFSGRVQIPEGAYSVMVHAAKNGDTKPVTVVVNGIRWNVAYSKTGSFTLTLTQTQAVLVADSKNMDRRSRMELYVISEVDGKGIRNAIIDSDRASTKQGARSTFNAVMTKRELPVKKMKVKLAGC